MSVDWIHGAGVMAHCWGIRIAVHDSSGVWAELEPLLLERLARTPPSVLSSAVNPEQPERRRAAARGAPGVSTSEVTAAFAASGGLRGVEFVPSSAAGGAAAGAKQDLAAHWHKKPCLALFVSRGARVHALSSSRRRAEPARARARAQRAAVPLCVRCAAAPRRRAAVLRLARFTPRARTAHRAPHRFGGHRRRR